MSSPCLVAAAAAGICGSRMARREELNHVFAGRRRAWRVSSKKLLSVVRVKAAVTTVTVTVTLTGCVSQVRLSGGARVSNTDQASTLERGPAETGDRRMHYRADEHARRS